MFLKKRRPPDMKPISEPEILIDALAASKVNAAEIAPESLAFLGDAVYSLLVRERLMRDDTSHTSRLHEKAAHTVCASTQAKAARNLESMLTEEELQIYKRARNTKLTHVPRNQSPIDYHAATGLEALFGYLYLTKNFCRLHTLFNYAEAEDNEEKEPG